MYRSCIRCSGRLGANGRIERFPVGRALAFDPGQGRLWAVCVRCGYWNLAPIDERWEAIEEAERLFASTHARTHHESLGVAEHASGLRLIRIGDAAPHAIAGWRYGRVLRRRYLRSSIWEATRPLWLNGLIFSGAWIPVGLHAWRRRHDMVHVVKGDPLASTPAFVVRRYHLEGAFLREGPESGRPVLEISTQGPLARSAWPFCVNQIQYLSIDSSSAHRLMLSALFDMNRKGASEEQLTIAESLLRGAGSSAAYIDGVARRRLSFPVISYGGEGSSPLPYMQYETGLALEMALHEEQERLAMQGDLAFLRSAWREAEQIADIVDELGVSDSVEQAMQRLKQRTGRGLDEL